MGRNKDVVHRIHVDLQTSNRLEVDKSVKGFDSLADQYEKIIWFYLKHESPTEAERKLYAKRLLAWKTGLHVIAMRERLGDKILENLTELLVQIYLYKRRNNNVLYAVNDEREFFIHLNELEKVDKNLFDEIIRISSDFGKVKSRYRAFVKESGSVDQSANINGTILTNNSIKEGVKGEIQISDVDRAKRGDVEDEEYFSKKFPNDKVNFKRGINHEGTDQKM